MVQSTCAASLMALAFFASANAHMIMKTPYPYGADSLNNSPLDASGSDYPCKLRGASTWTPPSQANNFAIGESQTLSFTGSAVHGGGSCQISLSTDKQPTASSKWQVIHSIEGGCPVAADGNLGSNTDNTFQFKIPEGISPGDYTLAWTWFNKIGNREMYMNCAPVTVTGAKKRRYAPSPPATSKRQASFPEMAVANVKSVNSCETVANTDVVFPDPGASVQKVGSPSGAFVGEGCPLASGGSGSSSGSGSSGSGASPAPTAAASSAPAITQTAGGVFATPATTSAAASTPAASAPAASAPAASAPAASAPAAPAPAPSAAPSSAAPGNSSTGSAAQGASCTSEGSSVCAADGQSYMVCASGYWQKMPVAAGMKCSGSGVQANVNVIAANARRHAHEHIRRSGHA